MIPPPDSPGIRDEVALALDIVAGLFEHSPVGFAFLDTERRYVRINPALARVQRRPVVSVTTAKTSSVAQVEVLFPDRLGGVHLKHRAPYAANLHPRPMGRGWSYLPAEKMGPGHDAPGVRYRL